MELGSIVLGVLGLVNGARQLRRGLTDGGALAAPPAAAAKRLPGKPGTASVKTYEVKNLDDRIRYIARMARKGRLDPRMREFTVKLVSRRCGGSWCTPEKNWRAEADAVFKELRQRYYRYVRDTYGVDLYQHPKRTLQFGGGDCDDATILMAAALGAIGFKVKARVIQTVDADDWNHIYALVEIPAAGGAAGREGGSGATWVPYDLSMDKPPGWEAPRSMVKRVRDYPL